MKDGAEIADYAFLSDCQSAALVSRGGSVDWFCLPRFDSPSLFGRLLDSRAGHWSIAPDGPSETTRRYLPDTLVLETTFQTADGKAILQDALIFQPGSRRHGIGQQVPHAILRSVRGVAGTVSFRFECAPRFEYGLARPVFTPVENGYRAKGGPIEIELTSSVPLDCPDISVHAHFSVSKGERASFVLQGRRAYLSPDFGELDAEQGIADTVKAWRSWTRLHEGRYQGFHERDVKFGASVLQGLTYQPSGAMVAAATTSLPEVEGGTANWDYRYAWLRDFALALRARWIVSSAHEPTRFFQWIESAGERIGGEQPVQIMYGIQGEKDLAEHSLDHLEGFHGARPVRAGNAAWRQLQLDVMGEVLNAAHLLRNRFPEYSPNTRRLLTELADLAAATWREPDAGMWESRDRLRQNVSAKVLCWVALDRAIALAPKLGAKARTPVWKRERKRIRDAVLSEGWSEKLNAFSDALGSDHLDASVLLMPLVGFIDAKDERMLSTIRRIEERLTERSLVRRWQDEPNAFVICSFWLAECLALAGERDRAEERFCEVASFANDLGLMAEMVDPVTGKQMGNTPQAFSHVGLINAAFTIDGGTTGWLG